MRSLRLACAALVAAAALAGCADKSAPEAAGTPTPTSSPATPQPAPSVNVGAEGMDVRYLDEDGEVRTLRVEDFPR